MLLYMSQSMRLHMELSTVYTLVLANSMTGLDAKDLLVSGFHNKILPRELVS